MPKFLIFILSFLVLLVGCHKSSKTYYDTGEVNEEFEVNQDGLKHGLYTRYFINGTVQEKSEFVSGIQVGIKKLFYEDGKLESESQYQNGKLNGYHRVYHKNGKLSVDAIYENNEFSGIFKKFSEKGVLIETVNFVNGTEDGPFEEYYENGKIKWKGTYKTFSNDNIKEVGELDSIGLDGELKKKMICDSLFNRTVYLKVGTEVVINKLPIK